MTDTYYLARSESAEKSSSGCTLRATYRIDAVLCLSGDAGWTVVVESLGAVAHGRPGPWGIFRGNRPKRVYEIAGVVEYDGHECADGDLIYLGDLDDGRPVVRREQA